MSLGVIGAAAVGFYCWKLFKARVENQEARQEVPAREEVPQNAIKRQLLGARKVTCQLLGIILEEATAEELARRGSATIRDSSVTVLLDLARSVDLYLLANVCNDQNQEAVLLALEKAGLFREGFSRDKVLFYETDAGSNSFVRQLEPDWHIDDSVERVLGLSRFVPYELLVYSGASSSKIPSNVCTTASIESYFPVVPVRRR